MSRAVSASVRSRLTWSVGPSIPSWIVLAVLGLLGHLDWIITIFSGVIVFVMVAAIVLSRLTDFDKLVVYAEQLVVSPDTAATSATGRRLLAALTALRNLWTDPREQVAAL
jgi:hypothetical protein